MNRAIPSVLRTLASFSPVRHQPCFSCRCLKLSSVASSKPNNKRPEKTPWWRTEDEDVINARLARRLISPEEPSEAKDVQEKAANVVPDVLYMKDVQVHAEIPLEEVTTGSELDEADDVTSAAAPAFGMSYNLAAYVDRSPTLQKLVDLGVDLSRVESTPGGADILVKLDFDQDIAPRIRFLLDQGVPDDRLGWILSRNPAFLTESLDNLQVRVDYLESKKFPKAAIARILGQSALWLSYDTVQIDRRLGFFQRMFQLSGDQTRQLAVALPPLITSSLWRVKENVFSLKKELGFDDKEIRAILLGCPRIFRMHVNLLRKRFDFVHNEMQFSHELIAKFPGHTLNTRTIRLSERHKFLKSLGRDQYDPKEPNYVSPIALSEGTDAEFATKVARVPVQVFNSFLKTL